MGLDAEFSDFFPFSVSSPAVCATVENGTGLKKAKSERWWGYNAGADIYCS